jgi:hypothetical protein
MKKNLVLAVVLASLGLGGCVAYDPYYDSAYYAPTYPTYGSSVVVAPTYYGHYSYYRDGRRYYR